MTTLLIVDDESANLAVLSNVLQPHYRVLAANSGARALEVAAGDPRPDLILLDVMMPDMDGFGVLARLRAEAATRDIPVIFVTALTDEINEEHGLQLGAVDYIAKPIKPAIVLVRVAAQLELKQARDRLADENAWLEAEVARRLDEISAIQEVGIHALAELAETRDPETGNHIRRTQEYVAALALQLRDHPRFQASLAGNAIPLLSASAPLHDIGKVGIPDHILLKPGKLDEGEFAIMKTHAKLGADAIERALRLSRRPVDFLDTAREIAHWHHEKWDGSGYPDGLAGEAIPVSARLMALADVFDALITPRVYKPAFSFDEARRIVAEGRGRHFDPDMVDAFLAGFETYARIAACHADAPPET
ncbi:MAG: response regulator [Betaproteobacteria bacterium]|nr:response regulator [Betaproteobacteria bacterium]